MRNTTLRLDDETIDELDEEADERGLSRSEYLRMLIRTRDEYTERDDEYDERIAERDERIEELERENQRLNRERRQLLEMRDEHTELVTAVQEEQSLAKRKAGAGIFTRAKWWLTGDPAARED